MSTTALSFYDHHRQSYGYMPLRDGLAGEFHVGDYSGQTGVGDGGEFSTFLDGDAWYLICVADDAKEIRSRDDLTALLIKGGLQDRSDNPVGHIAVCSCCGRATESEQR